jgi:hypothetical protein
MQFKSIFSIIAFILALGNLMMVLKQNGSRLRKRKRTTTMRRRTMKREKT